MKKVLILDTSMFCVWLQVPGYESCGETHDIWNFERVNQKITDEIENQSTLILPLATFIETGNHISHVSGNLRYMLANQLCHILHKCIQQEEPWAAFSEQVDLWNDETLTRIATEWPDLAVQSGLSIADATIINVAHFYYKLGCYAEILTGDAGLRAYEPVPTEIRPVPRRRK
ncbi:hypothetical protein C7N43_18815 [Sphingobacteriales bacterium UPWRP_1]|nr:hypothetical protein BVG80_02960 [Sphingobacteriales bacterium TSM_CSM]PSJ75447.1 hypothetical protein C7N43_18815 [Sphingobacteriales bacterium UPWRP_1]